MQCKVKDTSIHYVEVGSGRPLLCLHGWALDHRHMHYSYEPLFKERSGWRRIYPDLPGMGLTRATDWIACQDDMLDIVIAFVDAVASGEQITVAGLSYGGYLARGLIHHCGARLDGVMMTVPFVEPDETKTKLPPHRVVHEDADFLQALLPDEQDIRKYVVTQSIGLLEGFREVSKPAGAIADYAFLERLSQRYAFSFDVDALAEPFPTPTLILCGRHDSVCGYREIYQRLDNYPRASYAVLDGGGHVVWYEQEKLFHALAGEWLDRVESYAR